MTLDLERALQPVIKYYAGGKPTTNTVLAAYLRAARLPTTGAVWQLAKTALADGSTFAEAALWAAQHTSSREASGSFQAVDASPAAENPTANPPPRSGDNVSGWSNAYADGRPLKRLEWFPKQFGPGDIDGVGAKRLLGTPSIKPAWVLVRETGQNSWDARGNSPKIDFVVNLRRLSGEELTVLRDNVFTGNAPKTGLASKLRAGLWVLEISDRGTKGLNGPIRNDLAVELGVETNFIDFIFNIGAPRDVHLGGGTYGFGKTIAYSVSGVGTTLVWSRCQGDDGRLEHRLIGSGIGEGFDRHGLRYTGRHWWGRAVPAENRVEPLLGTEAQQLAEAVFSARFDAQQTGTTIMILDPQLGGETREEDIREIGEAVVWNLWPKLMADQSGRARMNISVQLDGVDQRLPVIESHPALSGAVACLEAVRAVQDGRPMPVAAFPVTIEEIRSMRPKKLLGHLALARYPHMGPGRAFYDVILMRHEAELVVQYLQRQPLDVDGFQWVGVFKPASNVDDSFAMSEPPAHDCWEPAAVSNRAAKTDVSVALREIKRAADGFVRPRVIDPPPATTPSSTAIIADQLADLVGVLAGPGASSRQPRKPRTPAKREAKPIVEVLDVRTVPATEDGWSRTELDVVVSGAGRAGIGVQTKIKVGVEGGSEGDDEVIKILGWRDSGGFTEEPQRVRPGESRTFVYESQSDLAVDVSTAVVDI